MTSPNGSLYKGQTQSLSVALDRQRQYLDQIAENSGRLARVAVFYDTTGNGETTVQKPIEFGLTFTEMPSVVMGSSLLSGQLVRRKLPNTSAGVWKWKIDPKGYYVGAHIYIVVDSAGQDYNLRHSIVFEGDAIKLVAAEALNDVAGGSGATTNPSQVPGVLPNLNFGT